jgi:hypothetical protein
MIKNIFIIENNIIVNKIAVDNTFDLNQVEYVDESSKVVLDIGYVYDEESQTFVNPYPQNEPTLDELLNQASSVESVQLQQQLDQIISNL